MSGLLAVCLGGAVGSGARYLITLGAARAFGASFPFGTFIVNVLGCFFVAFLLHITVTGSAVSPNARLALTTGLMGGLTTYSTFNWETTALFRQGAFQLGVLNFAATVVGCGLAGMLGLWAGQKLS